MANHMTEALVSLWDEWYLPALIFTSLFLQLFLLVFASSRKRTRGWNIKLLWLAYLLSDKVPGLAITAILAHSICKCQSSSNDDLMLFWLPLLLVHIAGPDTVTAFSLEDNQLWLRHLFGFFQFAPVVFLFIQSRPFDEMIRIPTSFLLFAGIIKYFERTCSLYLASASSLRDSLLTEPDPGSNYAKLMDVYFSQKMAGLPTQIVMLPEPDRVVKAANRFKELGTLTDLQVVQYAYHYFVTFKGLVVDLIFSLRERNQSRDFFLTRSAEDAFKIVEAELNFFYEVLFTKLPVVYYTLRYFCQRCFCFIAFITSFVYFYYMDKKSFEGLNVGVTYTLLIGAITVDVMAFIMLVLSDRTVVALHKSPDQQKNSSTQSRSSRILSWFLRIMTKTIKLSCFGFSSTLMSGRWAETMSTYNLIYHCLNKSSNNRKPIFDFALLDKFWYADRIRFNSTLRNFIFTELKVKSLMADDLETANEICSAKGEWALKIENYGRTELLPFVVDVDYDECLLLWHIATDLCYNDAKDEPLNNDYRDISKLISDYMLYLLVMEPDMMAAVSGIGLIRFRDTCAEATRFLDDKQVKLKKSWTNSCCSRKVDLEVLHQACENILAVNTEVPPLTVKGDKSKSIFFDAAILAKTLRKLPQKDINNEKVDKWFIISKVWVELLSFAATHIRSDSHAQQLSKGGELITIVWLLMAHFGLGHQFQINEGHARAKLIVEK
ncbi:Calcium uniporter protein [Heracleum sosnowskyi]|uniref:Calcium uniporter protein n=1 Tax=Heracleum sosnowskyi TaxID=360622 RepID=A0AAD8MIE2_9APIA|nr:Calcium uniporter protein [Heracleum sosnowskyi]